MTKSSNNESGVSELCSKLLKEANSESISHYVTGSIVIRAGKVLLLQRTNDDFMGGLFEVAGGSVEKNEPLESAVSRELYEETGLKINEIKKYVGFFDYLSGSGVKTRQFNFFVSVPDGDVKLSKEHQKYVWVAKEDIHKYNISDDVKKIIEKALA